MLAARLRIKAYLFPFVAIAAIFIVLPLRVQATDWVITIDARDSTAAPKYSVNPSSGGCPDTHVQDPKNLKVCPGDTVSWVLKSSGGNSEVYFFHQHRIFEGSGGKQQVFHSSNDNPTVPAIVKKDPNLLGGHEYYVAAVDLDTGKVYIEDPKIKIGNKPPLIILNDMKRSCERLLHDLADDHSAIEEAKKLCSDVSKLADQPN